MHHIKLVTALLLMIAFPLRAAASPILGDELASFSVLAGVGGATNTPTEYPIGAHTKLSNNLGTTNTEASGITGFFGAMQNSGPGQVGGAVFQGSAAVNARSFTAQDQLVTAMATLQAMRTASTVEFGDLSGMTLAPGVYSLSAPAFNLGVGQHLTLDGAGQADALWVFLATSSIIMGTDSSVSLINTGPGAAVFWDAVSSISLNVGAQMVGNFLADTSITMLADVNIGCGRALAHTGDVTMSSDTITSSNCFGSGDGLVTSNGLDGTFVSTAAPLVEVPEPSTLLLTLAALTGAVCLRRRRGTPLSSAAIASHG